MKITIEIDHKTTQNDIDKLIGALQSVYAASKDTLIRKEQVKLTKDQVKDLSLPLSFDKTETEAPVSENVDTIKKYDTVQNVFESLDIPRSISWIYYLVREKKIPYQRIGRSALVNREDVLNFYRRNQRHD